MLISIDEGDSLTWGYKGTSTGATSQTDGLSNTNKIKDGAAAKWCLDKGVGWYLPALNELKVIYNLQSKLNTVLSNIGGTRLWTSGYYWSSTENGSGSAYHVYFYNGNTSSYDKSYSSEVRAVRAL